MYNSEIGNIGIIENPIKFKTNVCTNASTPYSITGLNNPPPVGEPKKNANMPDAKYMHQQVIQI